MTVNIEGMNATRKNYDECQVDVSGLRLESCGKKEILFFVLFFFNIMFIIRSDASLKLITFSMWLQICI